MASIARLSGMVGKHVGRGKSSRRRKRKTKRK